MMMTSKKVAFHTLGCKLNFAETSTLTHRLEAVGYEEVDFKSPADVYVINSCSVTENANKDCRALVRKAKRLNPDSKVVVLGCYAQLKPEEIAEMSGVDLVLGAKDKFNLSDFLQSDMLGAEKVHACEIDEVQRFEPAYNLGGRTRAFLKVQDGCDYKCTFCTIPLARGSSRSGALDDLVQMAKEIANHGAKEIVLTGVNIGDYGKGEHGDKKHAHRFIDLLQALDRVEGIERFRISSIEPNLLSQEIIDFVADSERFMPHFHMPLQSGSDELLARMKRRYRSDLFRSKVAAIKERMPFACIGVDVIVGFPGESEARFLETYDFLKALDVSYLHVFTYSERPNTEAIDMDGVVPMAERKARSESLRLLSEEKRNQFYKQHLGSKRQALFETSAKNELMEGYTDNYIRVAQAYNDQLTNQSLEVLLKTYDEASNNVLTA
ncbi:unnamed protein product [Cyprideis torosa]|uniref:Uncharacterized protein n=1 Tax=Cyprideis torosa TaxID=163714 RepID=A0A7R8WZ68_9CRUS|nr:unnamed protein product [Cyprideis torosa]CAG0909079.1 unnamed protein product [Cyprideis torosa]